MFAEYVDGLRDYAEQRMEESGRVTVWRVVGSAIPPDSRMEREVWEAAYTDLPFRLHPGTERRAVVVAEVEQEVSVRTGSIPVANPSGEPIDVRDGDRLLLTAGEYAGLVYRVIEADGAHQSTAHRLPLVADSAPEGGWS